MGCCQGTSREPTTWEECGTIIDGEKHTIAGNKFHRQTEDQKQYNVVKSQLLSKYVSLNDHILHTKLGYEATPINDKKGSQK